MTLLVLVSCDGTPADRPDMTLKRCRAFLPLPFTDPATLAAQATAAGYRVLGDRHLCPACARGHRCCESCGGPLGGARCPMCDPRPNSADRAAGCICPDGRGAPFADWQPAAGCPIHTTRSTTT